MNYIMRLQHQLASANATLRAQADAIQVFRIHLASSKFASPGPDGERRDWIAVSGVRNWLSYIANADGGAQSNADTAP